MGLVLQQLRHSHTSGRHYSSPTCVYHRSARHLSASQRKATPGLALYNFKRSLSADKVVEEIRAQGGNAQALEADLSELATIPLLFDQAEALFGTVDVLIN